MGIILFILCIAGMHCLVKLITALFFDVWFENQKLLLLTGALLSAFQIGVLFVILLLFNYIFCLVATCLMVLLPMVEFAVYRWKMIGVSWKRSLLYTLISTVCCWVAAILVIYVFLHF